MLIIFAFLFSQATYFLSAFKNILPTEFSYSEYARHGFFELCAISIINLFVILVINILCKQEEGNKPKGLKIFTIIISVFTLMIIATALSKMCMYIRNYGLTLLRVYTSWFMILLAIIFIIVMLTVFIKKIKIIKAICISFIAMFALLSFYDIDGMIANYNITQYQKGNLKELDIKMMYNLSDSAIQYIAPLVESDNDKLSHEAYEYLQIKKVEMNNNISDFNFSSYNAKRYLP